MNLYKKFRVFRVGWFTSGIHGFVEQQADPHRIGNRKTKQGSSRVDEHIINGRGAPGSELLVPFIGTGI